MTRDETPDAPDPDDQATADAPATTSELLHRIAVGLTRVQIGLEKAADEVGSAAKAGAERAQPILDKGRERVREGVEKVTPAVERAGELASETGRRARSAGKAAVHGASAAGHGAAEAVQRARSLSVGLALRAEERAEHAAENLRDMSGDLANRARAARAAGVDFFDRHREEIIALIITAAKVAAVIGIRRLARPNGKDAKGARGGRFVDAMAILGAVVTHVGELLARNPSALPLLREMYAKGDPSEQAVVGMLVGPALGSDPDHAADVVREFLEGASSEAAADTIARRTLAPLMADNPALLEKVLPWVDTASRYVKRAALIALSRQVEDRESRLGDIVAASVVVLEDHDEEVREALGWLLQAASEVDVDQVARAVRDRLARLSPESRARARALVADMPGDLQARIEALEAESD